MIKVSNVVEAYEVDGQETTPSRRGPSIIITSHWNRECMIVLQVGTGEKLTIAAKDLKAAIENATNSVRF